MTYDLAIWTGLDSTVSPRVVPLVVTGPAKLAQKVSVLLLTDIDEPSALGRGTHLLSELTGANTPDNEAIINIFSIALGRVLEQIQVTQPADTPDDEWPVALRVSEVVIGTDSFRVSILIETAAGTTTVFTMPSSALEISNG